MWPDWSLTAVLKLVVMSYFAFSGFDVDGRKFRGRFRRGRRPRVFDRGEDRPARYRCDAIGDGLGRLLALQAIVLAQSGLDLCRALELRRSVETLVFDRLAAPKVFDWSVSVPQIQIR